MAVIEIEKKEEGNPVKPNLIKTATILFVDDEPPIRTFGACVLSNVGYKVLDAENGAKGLEIIGQRGAEIDLIITDTIMPLVTGPEMIMKARRLYPNVKVLFMSGYTEENFSYPIKVSEELNFLAKPFTLDLLVTKVKEILGKI